MDKAKVKYSVAIPSPSAKRMAANKKIVLTLSDGWTGDFRQEFHLYQDDTEFVFEVDENYEPIHSSSSVDGSCFLVEIVYTNSTKSRTETFRLIPMKC